MDLRVSKHVQRGVFQPASHQNVFEHFGRNLEIYFPYFGLGGGEHERLGRANASEFQRIGDPFGGLDEVDRVVEEIEQVFFLVDQRVHDDE